MIEKQTRPRWLGGLPTGVEVGALRTVEIAGTFTPEAAGVHRFAVTGVGAFQLDVAGESLDRKRAVRENSSEPLDLLDAIDCAGAGVFQSPGQQVAAVVLAPGAAGGAVALQIVRIDLVVKLA